MLLCMQLKLVTINSRENCYILRHFTYFKIGYILQLVNYTDNIFLSVAYTCKVVNKMKNWFCLSSQIVVFFFLIYNPFFFSLLFGCAGSSLLPGLSSSCGEWGYSQVVGHGFLIAVASLVLKPGL